jgi:hypothetical protein
MLESKLHVYFCLISNKEDNINSCLKRTEIYLNLYLDTQKFLSPSNTSFQNTEIASNKTYLAFVLVTGGFLNNIYL